MTLTRPRTAAALVAGVLLLAPLAGCGGDDKKPAASKESSASATPTDDASASAEPSGTPVDADEFFDGVQAAIKDRKSVHLNIGGDSSIKADGDLELGSSPRIKLTANFTGAEQQMIIADDVLYMQQSAGGKYVKIGKDDPTLGSLLGVFSGFDPGRSLAGIRGGVTKVLEVGPVTEDGEELTKYAVVADASKADGLFKNFLGSSGNVVLNVYLDGDSLLHRIDLDLTGQSLELTFSDWDEPVDITVPTGSQLLNVR